jgi:hypothetical protein
MNICGPRPAQAPPGPHSRPDPYPTRTRPGPSLGPYGPRPTVGLTRPHRPVMRFRSRHRVRTEKPLGLLVMRYFQVHAGTKSLRVGIHFRIICLSRPCCTTPASSTNITPGTIGAPPIRIGPATAAAAAGGTTTSSLRLFQFVGKPPRILVILVMLIPDLFDVGLLLLQSATHFRSTTIMDREGMQ